MRKRGRCTRCVTSMIVGCLICLTQSAALAMMAGHGQRVVLQADQEGTTRYSLAVSTTLLNGKGKEYRYDPRLDGMKISDRRWDASQVLMIGGQLSVQYGQWLTLNGGLWTRLRSDRGTMTHDEWNTASGLEDRDDPRMQTYFAESHSEVEEASIYDLNSVFSVMRFNLDTVHLRGILGYKKETWQWQASDGYSIAIEQMTDETGDTISGSGTAGQLDGAIGSYEQKTTIPYAGVSLDYAGEALSWAVHALYSNRVELDAVGAYLQQNLRAEDSFSDGTYWALGANMRWKVNPNITLAGSVEYEEIQTIRGDSILIVDGNDLEQFVDDGAGAGYHSLAVTCSMIYFF